MLFTVRCCLVKAKILLPLPINLPIGGATQPKNLSDSYVVVQGSSLHWSRHVGRVVERALFAGLGAAVGLAVQEVGGLVHVDPGSVDRHLVTNLCFKIQEVMFGKSKTPYCFFTTYFHLAGLDNWSLLTAAYLKLQRSMDAENWAITKKGLMYLRACLRKGFLPLTRALKTP